MYPPVRTLLAVMGLALGLGASPGALAADVPDDARVEVPLELGVGPVGHLWFGQLGVRARVPIHTGLVVTTDLVLDREWFREHPDRIPARWRDRVGYLDEVRVRRLWFLPESYVLSPPSRLRDATDLDADGRTDEILAPWTSMVGASWRPVSLSFPFITWPVQVAVGAAPRLTLLYVTQGALDSDDDTDDRVRTVFFRPGLDLTAEAILPLTDVLRLRAGLDAQAYLPQALGGFGLGKPGERMAFLMRGFVEVRYRVPVRVRR